MSLKAQVEALIYAAEEPITLEQLATLLKDAVLADITATRDRASQAHLRPRSESAQLPELDGCEDELNGLEPGPLMPELSHFEEEAESALEELERLSEVDAFREGDEPFFAVELEAGAPGTVEVSLIASESAASAAAGLQFASSPESASEALEPAPEQSANVAAPESNARKRQPKKSEEEIARDKAVRARLREVLIDLAADYASEDRGMEIRQVAGGYRMATKPQHHDLVRAFAKSLKPPTRLSLAALETLAVIAYKQPITAPEISEIRGVESGGVLGTLLDRKLITTAGRKQVIGRPMQYKTSRDFLLRFGLNDLNELPSMEEFSQLALEVEASEMPSEPQAATPYEAPAEESQAPREEEAAEAAAPDSQSTAAQSAEESAEAEPEDAPADGDTVEQ